MKNYPPNHLISEKMICDENDVLNIINRFGTPIYIYDFSAILTQYNFLRNALDKNIRIFYSLKANPNVEIIKYLNKCGANFEASSYGEMLACIEAGVNPNDIIFVGPGKSFKELEYAVKTKIGVVVVESDRQLFIVDKISKEYKTTTKVALRINVGSTSGTLSMGGQTQFGIEENDVISILCNKERFTNINFCGIHSYFGTGIQHYEVLVENTKRFLDTVERIEEKSGTKFSFVDVGGGFGIPYFNKDEFLNLELMKKPFNDLIKAFENKRKIKTVFAIESGRFLVGTSGLFVTKVLDLKKNNGRVFTVLDGGTNIVSYNESRYGFNIPPIKVIKLGEVEDLDICTTICGPLCTPTDRLAFNVDLPNHNIDDIIVFYHCGAYGYTTSPGLFLSHGFPVEVALYQDKTFKLIRKPISPEDMISFQLLGN